MQIFNVTLGPRRFPGFLLIETSPRVVKYCTFGFHLMKRADDENTNSDEFLLFIVSLLFSDNQA